MANKINNNPMMRPRFNFMWFWAAIAIIILGYSLFSDGERGPVDGDWNMATELVERGYVERIRVLDRDQASVY
ncbi:MAG: peptidase M41, partial [Alistipes sp.]|nr:peptidase M41 [Alistipes sp.]